MNRRGFESWQEIEETVEKAEAYWKAHKHPYVWADPNTIGHAEILGLPNYLK